MDEKTLYIDGLTPKMTYSFNISAKFMDGTWSEQLELRVQTSIDGQSSGVLTSCLVFGRHLCVFSPLTTTAHSNVVSCTATNHLITLIQFHSIILHSSCRLSLVITLCVVSFLALAIHVALHFEVCCHCPCSCCSFSLTHHLYIGALHYTSRQLLISLLRLGVLDNCTC